MNHPRVEKVISEFAQFNNWEDRYKKMIEVGKQLEIMPENLKTEENNNYQEIVNIDECKELLQQMATILQKIANVLGVK